jgi:tetratricopeptide (TPR) repeat protein
MQRLPERRCGAAAVGLASRMIIYRAQSRRLLFGLACLCVCLCGCEPTTPDRSAEEKEPYFQRGKALVNSLDYKGATEAFERALEVNPHNGLAHFELGLLCQRDETDLVAAIYHFGQFLKLHPDSEQAEFARQRIMACKQDFARSIEVSLAPVTRGMQRELERANAENGRLTAANRELQQQIETWKSYYARFPAGQTAPPNPVPPQRQEVADSTPAPPARSTRPPPDKEKPVRTVPASGRRTYTVKRGESLYLIAKRYGVRMNALLDANPQVSPTRLKAGQTLVIPAP